MGENSKYVSRNPNGSNWRVDASRVQQEEVVPESSWRNQTYYNQNRREPNPRYQQQHRQRIASTENNESHLTQTRSKNSDGNRQPNDNRNANGYRQPNENRNYNGNRQSHDNRNSDGNRQPNENRNYNGNNRQTDARMRQRTASPEYNESHLTQAQRKTASADVQRFWNQLAKRVLHTKSNKFELNLDEYSLWFETWKAAAAGATGPVQALPIAYLMLPATTKTSPAPSTIVAVLIQVRDVQLLLK